MLSPPITAVIPTYKRPKLLKRAVKSTLRQSYPHFEILIADNASGPETEVVIQELMLEDPRIKLLKHTSNIGLAGNFQAALMQVTTPYVCFLPDDDFLCPLFFEEALPFFDQYPDIAFCGGGALMIDQNSKIQKLTAFGKRVAPVPGYYAPPRALFSYLYSAFAICCHSLLFKTAILKEFGGFDPRICHGTDCHLISQCAAKYPVYLLTDHPHCIIFRHEGSISNSVDHPLFERELCYLQENLCAIALADQDKEELERFFKNRWVKIWTDAYHDFWRCKKFAEASVYAQKIYLFTGSFRWKKKYCESTFYCYLPFLVVFHNSFRALEKKLRKLFKKQRVEPERDYSIPDEAYWQNYKNSLEQEDAHTKPADLLRALRKKHADSALLP